MKKKNSKLSTTTFLFTDYLKLILQFIIPQQSLTSLFGLFGNIKNPIIKNALIRSFIRFYKVDITEAVDDKIENYSCFNDFFIRHLKPGVRPLAAADIICPVDGYISAVGKIQQGQLFQAKNHYYSIQQLLDCDQQLIKNFKQGYFITLYLSPKDYHRIHMPLDGKVNNMLYIPGKLFSVQPVTVNRISNLFARNSRLVIFFDSYLGPMIMVLVGAVIVGNIVTQWQGKLCRSWQKQYFTYANPIKLLQGEEIGYFQLGSTVILLFNNSSAISWQANLTIGSRVYCGQALALAKN